MNERQVQHLLAYLGYYGGQVDGIAGPATRAAVEAFQTAAGLEADGLAGALTQAALKQAVARDRFCPEEARWQGIRHFTREEFRCKCGGVFCGGFPAEPDRGLLELAERLRDHFAAPVVVTSGVRCPTHNARVGGAAGSRHLTGRAMDLRVTGRTAREVLAWVSAQPETGYAYAIDTNHVHMDVG